MSWRGAFCTEYIYCDKCRDVVRDHAAEGYPDRVALPVPSIIAGYFADSCEGEDVRIFKSHMEEAELCPGHKVVIAIMPEAGLKHFWTLEGRKK